MYTFGLNVRV